MQFDVDGALKQGYSLGEIANEIGSKAGFNVDAARKAGYSDDEIVKTILAGPSGITAGSATPPDTSPASALQYGAHNAVAGLASTAKKLPGETAKSVGSWLDAHTPDSPAGYQPAGQGFASALKSGQYLDAAGYLPRMGVEAAPDVAGAAGAGALGAVAGSAVPVVGNVAGGVTGAALYSAARNAGQNIDSVAANNQHTEPTTGDLVQGLATTAPQVALDAIGVGRFPGVTPALRSIKSGVGRVAADTALEASAQGARDLTGQVGTSAGTERGTTIDPYQTAAAAAGGGAARLGMAASREGAKGVGSAIGARLDGPPPSAEQVPQLQRLMGDYQAAEAGIKDTASGKPEVGEVFQALLTNQKAKLDGWQRIIKGLTDDQGNPLVSSADIAQTITPLIESATTGGHRVFDQTEGGPSTPLSRFKALPIPDEIKQNVIDLAMDADVTKAATQVKNGGGPWERFGSALGGAGTAGALLASGHPMLATGALMGNPALGRIFGAAGRVIDKTTGQHGPALYQQMLKAQDMEGTPGVSPLLRADDLQGATQQWVLDRAAALQKAQEAQAVRDSAWDQVQGQNADTQSAIANTNKAYDVLERAQAKQKLADLKNTPPADPTEPSDVELAAALQREQKLYQGDVDVQAQQKVNQQAFANARKLAQDGRLPTNGINSPTATLASLAQSAQAANRVRDLAAGSPGGETASVTGNTPDPIPVNTPIRAGTRTPTPAPGGLPPFRPDTPSDVRNTLVADGAPPSPGSTPAPAPATPGAASPQVPMALRWLQNGDVANFGRRITQDDVNAGIDLLRQRGSVSPAQAEALKAHTGGLDRSVLDAIKGSVREYLGATSGNPQGGSASPIRNPQAWEARHQDITAHVEAKARAAERMGFPDMADVIRKRGIEKSAEGKRQLKEAYLERMSKRTDPEGIIEYQQALGMLNDPVLDIGI